MKLIVLSSPVSIQNELEIINSLFEEGLELFDLRKPDLSKEKVADFLKQIPKQYSDKVVLHSQIPSFHSLQEIKEYKEKYEYAFLSPVFDSISKPGYRGKISGEFLELRKGTVKITGQNIIALGGIDEDKIETIREMGFAGIAVLGAIWQSKNPVEKFRKIQKQIMNIEQGIPNHNLETVIVRH
jgi:thiamine-phosphate pyrophosphorylase